MAMPDRAEGNRNMKTEKMRLRRGMRKTTPSVTAAVMLAVVCCGGGVLAQNTFYTATSGNWTNALNWSDGVPDETKNAFIGRAGHATPATVTLDTAGAKALSLTLGWLTGDQGTVTMTDADLAVTAHAGFNIADNGIGTFNQSGGTVSVSGGNGARIGIANASHGTYTLDNNGQLTSTTLVMGLNAGSTGTVEVAGGQISLSGHGALSVGNAGYGSMNQSGGTVRADGGWHARIGNDAGSQGFYTLSGGVFSFPALDVGRAGTGVWMQTGGSVTNGTLFIGVESGAVGTYTLNDGTNVINSVFHVGREGGLGFLNLNGGSLTQGVATESTIGHKGTGTVTQTGGRLTGGWLDGHFLTLGNQEAGVGTYQISGGTLENCSIKNGVSGSGTFEVVGDSAVIDLGHFIQNAASLLSFNLGTGGTLTPIKCRSDATRPSSLDGFLLVDLRGVDKSVTDGTLTLIDYSATPAHILSGTFSSVTIRSRYGNNLLTPGTQGSLGSQEYYLDYGDGTGDKVTLEWSDKPTKTLIIIR